MKLMKHFLIQCKPIFFQKNLQGQVEAGVTE